MTDTTRKAAKRPELSEKQRRFKGFLGQAAREGSVIALVALCLYLGMALLTFHPADPGWASIGHDTSIQNHAGRIGAWIASLLMDLFGQMSYLFPAMCGAFAFMLIRRRNGPLDPHWPLLALRLGGFVLILVSACSLLSLYSIFGLEISSGGVIGLEISTAMVALFNLPATTLILVAIFLFAMTISTGLSWFYLMDALGALTLRAGRGSRNLFLKLRDKRQAGKEAKNTTPSSSAEPTLQKRNIQKKSAEPAVASNGESRWKRWLNKRREKRLEKSLAKSQQRQARRDGREDEPQQFESFSAKDEGEVPTATHRVAPSAGSSNQKSAKTATQSATDTAQSRSVKIQPFQKKEETAADAKKKTKGQGSLLEDLESPIPSITVLDPPEVHKNRGYSAESLEYMSRLLEEKLADFGVTVEVVEVNPGPVITRFEIKPAPGVKVSKISNLAKDLARSLAVLAVRVVEVIPGKSVVGIEIPNEEREIVRLSEVLGASVYTEASSPLTMALGNDIGGNPTVANLAKMPHLLVAGTTGSGKSVGVNAMILSILLKATPEEVRFIMVDPKMLELSIYEGIPHLLSPVVTDMKEAANALRWCVAEMERRYKLMSNMGVRNIAGYNRKVKEAQAAGEPLLDPLWKPDEYLDNDEQQRPELEALPFIVVVIDEFADMMMIVGKKVEELIARIAQKARAAGIHLILATQRPSVDVITGLIKANIPTRISFQVSSKIDSRTVLDQGGAEQLLGHGDMLYLPPGTSLPIRVHGAFVDDDEVHRVVAAWQARGEPVYVDDVLNGAEGESLPGVPTLSEGSGDSEDDALFDQAVAFVTETGRVSISSVQRKLKIGYNRAANLVEAMEAAGVVSAAGHNGAREVLAQPAPRD